MLVPVAAVFALNAGFAWDARIEAARNVTFSPLDADAVSWVDRAVPAGAAVATLAGGVPVETRDALRLTEFFNASIGPGYDLAQGYAPTLAASSVRLGEGGAVMSSSGLVDAQWVVAPRSLPAGRRRRRRRHGRGAPALADRGPVRVVRRAGS